MEASAQSGEPRQGRRPQVSATDLDGGSALQVPRGQHALMLAEFTRSITLMEAVSRVENELAETLRLLAAQDGDVVAARRLKLAQDAARGARAAARISERLRDLARRWAEQAEMVALHQALGHTARVLADLDRAESDLADVFAALASHGGPDLAVRRRLLAAEAAAAGRHARDRACALHQLAQAEAAGAQPDGTPVADTRESPGPGGPSRDQRLADIGRRLTQLRQARPEPPAGDMAQAARDAQSRAREADRHQRQSAAHSGQARQRAGTGFRRAAAAHDRAAGAEERSARAGIGDAAAHERRAAFHRAAAEADRQRAQEAQSQVADPDPSGHKTGPASAGAA